MDPKLRDQQVPPRVLLIEDDPDIAPLVYRALRKLEPGLSILWASDSKRARELISARDFDVVIADYSIDGGGTGWTILEEMRAMNPLVRCGIVSALPLGVDKLGTPFLRKPFDEGELLLFVQAAPLTQRCRSIASSRAWPTLRPSWSFLARKSCTPSRAANSDTL
jgi:DNA-binding response OmpR family regulator